MLAHYLQGQGVLLAGHVPSICLRLILDVSYLVTRTPKQIIDPCGFPSCCCFYKLLYWVAYHPCRKKSTYSNPHYREFMQNVLYLTIFEKLKYFDTCWTFSQYWTIRVIQFLFMSDKRFKTEHFGNPFIIHEEILRFKVMHILFFLHEYHSTIMLIYNLLA